jgi:hypothetical protein
VDVTGTERKFFFWDRTQIFFQEKMGPNAQFFAPKKLGPNAHPFFWDRTQSHFGTERIIFFFENGTERKVKMGPNAE